MRDLMPFIIVGIVSGSVYGIAAMGLVLSYQTSGVFNLAHGSIAAIAAGTFYQLHNRNGWPWPLAAVTTIAAVGVVFGALMERLGYVLSGRSTAMKVVATVALMTSLTSVFQLWYGFGVNAFPAFLPQDVIRVGGVNVGWDQIIVMGVGIVAVLFLTTFLRVSTLGRHTKAIIDDPVLFRLAGRAPTPVRRWGWMIGTSFASVSGILIAPSLGLNATALTLLVVQSFGAAAVGRFASLSRAYLGALGIGIIGALSTKYAVQHPNLNIVTTGLPFMVLFIVLIATPRRRLIELGTALERRAVVPPRAALWVRSVKTALPLVGLALVPQFVGAKLSLWTSGLTFLVIFLSLGLLVRTGNQISLCHMSFAAIGAVAFNRFLDQGVPWAIALGLAGAVAVPAGAFIAIPAIRLSGVYLALATLSFGILLEQQVYNTSWMFGHAGGSIPIRRPSFARTQEAYYYVVLVVVVLIVLLVRWAEQGQLGKMLRVRADSTTALASLGASVRTPPVLAFCLSAFIAGIAGALMGPIFQVVGPGTFQTVPTSLMLVALLVLAGRDPRIRSLGVAVGAMIGFSILPAYLTSAVTQARLNLLLALAAVHAAIFSDSTSSRRARRLVVSAAATPGLPVDARSCEGEKADSSIGSKVLT